MKHSFITMALAGVILTGTTGCDNKPAAENTAVLPIDAPVEISDDSLKSRGEYLVNVMGCHDCHSPKKPGTFEPDPALLLSGHPAGLPFDTKMVNKAALGPYLTFNGNLSAFAGPWGVSFSANLTSDETGIGNWTEEQFTRAIRQGKYKGLEGGRELLPPMPWQNFRNLTDQDLKAVFMYLKSTKPISNVVPPPIAVADF